MYKKHIFCCINERPDEHPRGCCKAKGSLKLHNYMKVKVKEAGLKDIRVNKSGCFDFCEEGPVLVVYPDAIWYSAKTTKDIDEIVNSHIINNQIVDRLLMTSKEKQE